MLDSGIFETVVPVRGPRRRKARRATRRATLTRVTARTGPKIAVVAAVMTLIAGVAGLLFAFLWTRATRPFGAELAAARLLRSGWADDEAITVTVTAAGAELGAPLREGQAPLGTVLVPEDLPSAIASRRADGAVHVRIPAEAELEASIQRCGEETAQLVARKEGSTP